MLVLGLSAFYHDSAAALVRDGEIIAAAQEERFTRKKNDADFPSHAAAYCLREAGVTLDDLDAVAFYDKPLLTFDRLLETYLAYAPLGFKSFAKAIPVWVKEKLLQKSLIVKALNELDLGHIGEEQLMFGYHHHSHAAAAYYPCRHCYYGWCGRVGDDLHRGRQRPPYRAFKRSPVSALVRPALFGIHLLPRLQGE